MNPPRDVSEAGYGDSNLLRAELRPGDRLGPFRLVRLLGRGGEGQVYEAVETERDQRVALKILHTSGEDLARIRAEFRALDGIAHSHIIHFYELGHHAETTYFTMQLIEGTSLIEAPVATTLVPTNESTELNEMTEPSAVANDSDTAEATVRQDVPGTAGSTLTARPSELEPARWLLSLVGAVEAVHQQGLLHLDIKPSNLLVDPSGRLLLVDFGLATRFDPESGRAPAPDHQSPGYSAPEHMLRSHVSPSSDWFGVGATLFTALVGRPPTRDLADERATVAQSEPLGALCAALLAPDPVERADADSIRQALGERLEPQGPPTTIKAPELADPTERIRNATRALAADTMSHRIGIFHRTASDHVEFDRLERTASEDRTLDRSASTVTDAADHLYARCRQWESLPFGVLDDLITGSGLSARISPADTPNLARMLRIESNEGAGIFEVSRDHLREAARELAKVLSGDQTGRPEIHVDEFQWCDLDSLALLLDMLSASKQRSIDIILVHRSADTASAPLQRLRRWLLSAPAAVTWHEFDTWDDEQPMAVPIINPPAAELIRELDEHERSYLELCAIAGSRVSQDEIRSALPDPRRELETLWSLRSKGLVLSSGPRLSDAVEATPITIDTIRSGLPRERVQHLHLVLAEAARKSEYGQPAAIGHHYSNANEPALALRHLVTAARLARDAFAFDRSADYFLSALEIPAEEEEDRTALLAEAARVLRQCGRGRASADAWLGAASHASANSGGEDSKDFRLAAAEMLLTSGHFSEGRSLLREIAVDFGLRYPRTQGEAIRRAGIGLLREMLLLGHMRARSRPDPLALEKSRYCSAAFQGLMPIDPTRAAVFATEGVRWARRSRVKNAVGNSLVSLASGVLSPAGNRMRRWGSRMIHAAGRIAEEEGNPELLLRIEIARSTTAFWEGNWRAACDRAESTRRQLASTGIERAFDRNVLNLVQTRSLEELGRWHEASAISSEMYADAIDRDDAYAAVTARLNLGMLALARGSLGDARNWADRAVEHWPGKGMQVQHVYALRVLAYADLCEGNCEAAWNRLDANWEAIRKGMHLRVIAGRVDLFALRGRIAAAMMNSTEDRDPWRVELKRSTQALEKIERPDSRAHAALLRACRATFDAGRNSGAALAAVQTAADLYREADMTTAGETCEYAVLEDSTERVERRAQLEETGLSDPDLWVRGFAPFSR